MSLICPNTDYGSSRGRNGYTYIYMYIYVHTLHPSIHIRLGRHSLSHTHIRFRSIIHPSHTHSLSHTHIRFRSVIHPSHTHTLSHTHIRFRSIIHPSRTHTLSHTHQIRAALEDAMVTNGPERVCVCFKALHEQARENTFYCKRTHSIVREHILYSP